MATYRPRALIQMSILFAADGREDVLSDTILTDPESGLGELFADTAVLLTRDGQALLVGEDDFVLGDSETPKALPVFAPPISMEIKRNNIRKADEMSVTIDYMRLPIDPRSIISMRVIAFLADVSLPAPQDLASTFAASAGQLGALGVAGAVAGEGLRRVVNVGLDNLFKPDDVAFVGFVDELSADLANKSKVKLTCRDYTSLFLDKKVPQTEGTTEAGKPTIKPKTYSLDRPLYEFVLELFDDVGDAAAQIKAEFQQHYSSLANRPVDHPLNTRPSDFYGKKTFTPSKGDDLWTVLSLVCDKIMAAPYFKLDVLRIEREAAITDGVRPYRFDYGRNVEKLSYKRKFTDSLRRPVEIRNYNPLAATPAERHLVARYPDDRAEFLSDDARSVANATGQALSSGFGPGSGLPVASVGVQAGYRRVIPPGSNKTKNAQDNAIVVINEGVFNQEELTLIAEQIYKRARREDIRGSFITREMRDLFATDSRALGTTNDLDRLLGLGDDVFPDQPFFNSEDSARARRESAENIGQRSVLQIGNKDTIIMQIASAEWQSFWTLDPQTAIEDLIDMGLDPDSARTLIQGSRAAERIYRPLYVKEATHKYSSDKGYELSIEFTASATGTDLGD